MAKFRYKIGRSMPPPVELLDASMAREYTIALGHLFHANCKCYDCATKRLIYEFKI